MGSVDRLDDRTFKVNFTSDGVVKLRDSVKDKLKEFMGDYTDDTLVEYVIVLLRNGRRKEEARNELNVFLGDDSDSFVSWLWDHLSGNLDLYVHPQESNTDEEAKINQAGRKDSHHLDSESERGAKTDKLSRSRHNREWKGLARDATEPPPLRSSEVDNIHFEEKPLCKASRARRSPSPRPLVRKKRNRPDERQHMKREAVSQASIDAPRRLLQFAVRDAVGTMRPSSSVKEPSLKRLRSVVSTSSGNLSAFDRPRRLQSVARVPNPMATVIRAVAEAAEDVTRVKSAGSVFDRLGCGINVSDTTHQDVEFIETAVDDEECRETAVGDEEYGSPDQNQEQTQSTYLRRDDYNGQYIGNITTLESEPGLPFDSMYDNEGYDDVNDMGRRIMDVSQTGPSGGNKGEDSLMVQYNVANNANDVARIPQNRDQDQAVAAANTSRKTMNTSRKTVNISVNVNTWKPTQYQESREVAEVDDWKTGLGNDAATSKSGVRLMKENSKPVTVGNGNAKLLVDMQESQKALPTATGSYTAGRPLEDADSRTIFVSNVHFAATKDSLSRHFNKFGEVLKVIIVTDAATGQPKGSAYVEFMRKEAADNALSLDGTSFMSRILKVVKRSSAHQEAATPVMTWPRIARGSPYAAARFARVPFARGIPGSFRPRLPIKPGARSMQWKRNTQATVTESGIPVAGSSVPSPTARSLTYVRTELKQDGNSGTT